MKRTAMAFALLVAGGIGSLAGQTSSKPAASEQPAERKAFVIPHVLEVVGRAVGQPMPAGLSADEQRTYEAQTEWLKSVQSRVEALGVKAGVVSPRDVATGQASGKRRGVVSGMGAGHSAVTSPRDAASGQASGKRTAAETPASSDTATAAASRHTRYDPLLLQHEIETLQKTIEAESQRFNTLSNVLKARHDMAMNAIRNMKA